MAITGTFIADFQSFYTAVQKAEVSLRSFETGAHKVEGSLNKMVDSFSGRRMIQDATLMAEAVERVGGVTRLTTAEKDRLNASLTQALAKYKALGMEAPASMQALERATARVTEPTQRITSAMDVMRGQVTAVGTAIGSFFGTIGANAVMSLAGNVASLAAQGAAMEPMVDAFHRLAAGIGQSGDEMLRVSRTATRGLINDLDLMQAANKAMLLGLPVTAEEMGTLGAAAIALGKAMGLSATQSMNDLITALGRSSPLILDNLGLTVKVGEANEAYAAKLGKTVAGLTDAEKKMAFYEAAMAAARDRTDELGSSTLTASERVTQLKTSWENFVHSVGETGATLAGATANAIAGVDHMSNSFQDAKAGGGPIEPASITIAREAKESYDKVRASVENMTTANVHAREIRPIAMTPEEIAKIEGDLTRTVETQIAYDNMLTQVRRENAMKLFNEDAARLKAQEDLERQYRAMLNAAGEAHLKAEGERLQKEADAHAAMVAAKIKADQQFWANELGGGLAIIGAPLEPGMSELARPQSNLRPQPLSQRGVVIYGAEATAGGPPTVNYAGATLPGYVPQMNPTINIHVGTFVGGDRAGADQLGRMAGEAFTRTPGLRLSGT